MHALMPKQITWSKIDMAVAYFPSLTCKGSRLQLLNKIKE
jgi:hypothetical protein